MLTFFKAFQFCWWL